MDYQLKQLRSGRLGRSLLAVESLEPRALLAGLCELPAIAMLAPQETLSAPAAELGSLRGGDGSRQPATAPVPTASPAPLESPQAGNPLVAKPLASTADVRPEQPPAPAPAPAIPPSEVEAEKPTAPIEDEGTDMDRWEAPGMTPEAGEDSSPKDSSPACPAEPVPPTEPAEPQEAFANLPVRAGSPSASTFVSLFVTAGPASSVNQPASIAAGRGTSLEEFHYFETVASTRHSGESLASQPLADVASRATYVGLWLIKKADLDDLRSRQEANRRATSATRLASPQAVAAQQPAGNNAAADARPTDIVQQALAAIAGADDALRQADGACAVAFNRTAEPAATAKLAASQALVNSAAKSNQPSGKQLNESQPCSPRWQLGLCSLVSILFSFRQPTESSSRSTAIRKTLLRSIQRTT